VHKADGTNATLSGQLRPLTSRRSSTSTTWWQRCEFSDGRRELRFLSPRNSDVLTSRRTKRDGCFTMRWAHSMSDDRVRVYLVALSKLCIEVAAMPGLLPLFARIVAIIPATLSELRRGEERRIAA